MSIQGRRKAYVILKAKQDVGVSESANKPRFLIESFKDPVLLVERESFPGDGTRLE
jgi:hypothetical protein